jgi:hypothetical protein
MDIEGFQPKTQQQISAAAHHARIRKILDDVEVPNTPYSPVQKSFDLKCHQLLTKESS